MKIKKPLPKSFSKNDMIGFAHYLRNGITNLEYSQKSHTDHLHDWIQYCDDRKKKKELSS